MEYKKISQLGILKGYRLCQLQDYGSKEEQDEHQRVCCKRRTSTLTTMFNIMQILIMQILSTMFNIMQILDKVCKVC